VARSYDRPGAPAAYHSQTFQKPIAVENAETPARAVSNIADSREESSGTAPAENDAVASNVPAQTPRTSSVVTGQPARVRLIALKSENVYAVTNYRINGGSLSYVLASGGTGSVDLTEVDWRATSRLNAEPISASQSNGHTY